MSSTSGVLEPRTGTPRASWAPWPGLRWRRVFPGEERQLGEVRRWLASLLPDCPARHDVASVATELGANAVRHTATGRGGWFAVEVTWHRPVVRVAVADCGAPGGPRMIDEPAGEHGRGLLVVHGLSVRSGVCGDHRGRLVWADVAWGDAGAAEPASSQDPYEAAIHDGQADLSSRFAGVRLVWPVHAAVVGASWRGAGGRSFGGGAGTRAWPCPGPAAVVARGRGPGARGRQAGPGRHPGAAGWRLRAAGSAPARLRWPSPGRATARAGMAARARRREPRPGAGAWPARCQRSRAGRQ